MEGQPACGQQCRMHRVPWRDNSTGLRGHTGVKHMRHLSRRSGSATQVRSIHERQDVCELSSGTRLRRAQEGQPGRPLIPISHRGRAVALRRTPRKPAIPAASARSPAPLPASPAAQRRSPPPKTPPRSRHSPAPCANCRGASPTPRSETKPPRRDTKSS